MKPKHSRQSQHWGADDDKWYIETDAKRLAAEMDAFKRLWAWYESRVRRRMDPDQ